MNYYGGGENYKMGNYKTATDDQLKAWLKMNERHAMRFIKRNEPIPSDIATSIKAITDEQKSREAGQARHRAVMSNQQLLKGQ